MVEIPAAIRLGTYAQVAAPLNDDLSQEDTVVSKLTAEVESLRSEVASKEATINTLMDDISKQRTEFESQVSNQRTDFESQISKGLLDNLKKCSQWLGKHYPNETLSADWDVLKEIMEHRATLEFPPSLHHVKGHQDDSKPKEDLPLPAQLNIEVDALADECMACHYNQHR
jgi:hypothetical protein